MKNRLYVAALALLSITACNYTVGECWPVGQGDGDTTVGGGPVLAGGTSGDWDTPPSPGKLQCNAPESKKEEPPAPATPPSMCPPRPADTESSWPAPGDEAVAVCSAACAEKCKGAPPGFSPSAFVFTTTVEDDGKDGAGGWQVSTTTLHFYRWTSALPESWTCSVKVEMPVHPEKYGVISANKAATMTAQIATSASFTVMNTPPEPPLGIYCIKLIFQMKKEFKEKFPNLGQRVE